MLMASAQVRSYHPAIDTMLIALVVGRAALVL
jgi:hypothetical protein